MNVTRKLSALRKSEHTSTVQIVEALVVCYEQRAYLPLGYSSMWDYLTGALRYSPAAASRRYKAMKCARKFPQVIGMLREHRVSLSSLARVESLLDETDSAAELLDRIDGKPIAAVEKIVAERKPQAKKPRDRVRRIAVKPEAGPLFSQPEAANQVEPRVAISTTLTEEEYEAFERARAIVSRKKPGARVGDVINELVDSYLKAKAPKIRASKHAKRAGKSEHTHTPDSGQQPIDALRPNERQATRKTRTRHIPRPVRDQVMLRDREQCQFVGADGHRCGAKHNLQIDHIEPYANGGTHDPENLRVLCAAHNRHRAEEEFGPPPQRN